MDTEVLAGILPEGTIEAITATVDEWFAILDDYDRPVWYGAIATAAYIGVLCDLIYDATGNPDALVISYALTALHDHPTGADIVHDLFAAADK